MPHLKLVWAATEAIQSEIFRRMTPGQRIEIALEMSDAMREISLSGLRRLHPEMSEKELVRELIHIMYGFTPEPRALKGAPRWRMNIAERSCSS